MQLRFHTQTAGVSLTAQQPEVNIARVAIEALAAVLGGTQSLHTDSFDEALALPTEKAARIALRTQQVIAHETGVVHVADPLGGSWFVEELTDELERQAEEVFAHLDELGHGSMLDGVVAAIEDGWFQGEIADAAYDFQRKVDRRARGRWWASTGSPTATTRPPPTLSIDPVGRGAPAQAPGARSSSTRRRRGRDRVRSPCAERRRRPVVNLMPALLEAAARVRDRRRGHRRARVGVRDLDGATGA